MGEHDDEKVLHGGGIHDDGRAFHPIDVGARFFQGAGGGANDPAYNDPDPYLDPDIYKYTQVFRFFHDALSPDSVLVNVRPFSVTKWESLYSTLFGTGTHSQFSHYPTWEATDPSFTPVIDETYRVVGHLGWITGEQICVPIFTVASDSPSALVLEKARLGEERQRILWKYDNPVQPYDAFPIQPAKDSWEPQYITYLRKGSLKDGSEEQRHQNNINYYLAGGGEALVGAEFANDLMVSRRYESFLMNDFRCLALVRPDGNLQGVLRVEKIPHQTREQRELKQLFEFIDIALTIWMIIDIATISVGLIRLGAMLAREAVIPAIRLAMDEGARSALNLLRLEARGAIPKVVGRMAGPVTADAFWAAGEVAPRQFTAAEERAWTAKIADRMKKLGIPKENIGIRGIPGESGEAFTASGSSRGANVRGRGISVHGNVEKDWAGFPEWNAASVDTRIDASIAHEWMEFNDLTHWETADLFAELKLRISKEAKELLIAMAKRGDTGRGFTEFTKAEWNAIKAAGKENASFEEKKAAAAKAK